MDKDDKNQRQNALKPLTNSDCSNISQLEIDVINVLENRVDIATFSPEYQRKISDFYRFHPVNRISSNASASYGGRGYWK
jgi:hypothetical protein